MPELDLDALRRTPRHRPNCALLRWERESSYTLMPACDCDWPAILAALEERKRLLIAAQELVRRGPQSSAWEPFFDVVAEIARKAEEVNDG